MEYFYFKKGGGVGKLPSKNDKNVPSSPIRSSDMNEEQWREMLREYLREVVFFILFLFYDSVYINLNNIQTKHKKSHF